MTAEGRVERFDGDEVVSSFKAQFVDRGRAGRLVRSKLQIRKERHIVTSVFTLHNRNTRLGPV